MCKNHQLTALTSHQQSDLAPIGSDQVNLHAKTGLEAKYKKKNLLDVEYFVFFFHFDVEGNSI